MKPALVPTARAIEWLLIGDGKTDQGTIWVEWRNEEFAITLTKLVDANGAHLHAWLTLDEVEGAFESVDAANQARQAARI